MPAPKNNQNAKKLKTKDVKEMVYKNYCDHLSAGFSQKSWHYRQDGVTLTSETMEKYLKEDVDFDPIHKEIALSQSLKKFEDLGMDMMLGKIKGCQPAIFQIIARNRYGWDRQIEQREDSKSAINEYIAEQKA